MAALVTVVGTGLTGLASAPPDAPASTGGYEATIVRDGRGVPHITAADWGSLGFGQGYALAEDRVCTLVDQIVKVRGERSKWFGPGDDDANINSDFAYRHLGLWEQAPTRWADQPERIQQTVDGYVAGVDAALEAGAAEGQWCEGQPWVGPITSQDLYAWISDVLLLASSRNLIDEIGSAQPPAADTTSAASAAPAASEPSGWRSLAEAPGASNGWALGADRSTTGGGLLLANPHFPWEGELRFWESHLTIPGELNVYGVGLSGMPGIQIGFNDAVAWTHTVSAGQRFTLYHYTLDPTDPTVYLVDGEPQQMEADDLTIEVLNPDGTTSEQSRTLYSTKHGPVLSVGPLQWSNEQALAIGDANAEITTVLEQYFGMDSATSMDEFQAVHAEFQGVPWVNTISTSADGRAWIVDTSATPYLSPEAIQAYEDELAAGGLAALAQDLAGVVLLDGSNSLFDWVVDPEAPAPGLIPYRQVPQLERSDYVFNANDSYWMSNPDALITGLSPLQGYEAIPQSPRTRTNVELLSENPVPWSIDDVESAILSDRALLADQLRSPLVEACRATPNVTVDGVAADLTAACDVLDAWDGAFRTDSVGAVLFREWLSRFDWADRSDAGALFQDSFDPAHPATTPAVPVDDRSRWLDELARAQRYMEFLGIGVDDPLGEWQFAVRTDDRIPIPGGTNIEGTANIVDCCAEHSTLWPSDAPNGTQVRAESELRAMPDKGFGYGISRGSSFVMALQYGPDGPVAEGFLTYGNPDDPADPAYRAGLDAWSAGEWSPLAFTDDAVAAAAVSSTVVTG